MDEERKQKPKRFRDSKVKKTTIFNDYVDIPVEDVDVFDDTELSASSFSSNPNLRPCGIPVRMTQGQMDEYSRCASDPIYFSKRYIKIVSLDEGVISFDMHSYQENLISLIDQNSFTIAMMCRQAGKTTTVAAYILWCAIFKPNYSVGILANKEKGARVILSRIALAYEHLPKWIQQGVRTWNKGSIELENGSRILAAASAASAIRGDSMNLVFCDEFAYLPYSQQHDFYSSVYPVITSGRTTKMVIISTPHGRELFHKIWSDAVTEHNSFVHMKVTWEQVPGRDAKWKHKTIQNTSLQQFKTEQMCEFEGSVDTLIAVDTLMNQLESRVKRKTEYFEIYTEPEDKHVYFITVDTSKGIGRDYSAFLVFDISTTPYKVVAVYKDNTIAPEKFPFYIERAANFYNDAFVLPEINQSELMINKLVSEHTVPNLLSSGFSGRNGQVLGMGTNLRYGVMTSPATKRTGCLALRSLIEHGKLDLVCAGIIDELWSFVRYKDSYAAEKGHHDDLVMCCVLLAWASTQDMFRSLCENHDAWEEISDESQPGIEDELMKGLGKIIVKQMAPPKPLSDGEYIERLLDDFNEKVVDSRDWTLGYDLQSLMRRAEDHF